MQEVWDRTFEAVNDYIHDRMQPNCTAIASVPVDVFTLRVQFRVVGSLVGALAVQPRQSCHLGLPLLLSLEEVSLLREKGEGMVCVHVFTDSAGLDVWLTMCYITRYGSTLYIGIAMVFVFSPYIRKFSSYFHFQVINDFIALNV